LISHDDPLPLDVAAILDSVATQLVIAVERVELASDLHQRRAEQRFRSLIENASDVIVVARPGQAWRSETPSLAAVLGYAANDGEPLDISGLIHDDDVSQALALVEAMLSGARSGPIRSEWRLRHADGRWLQMEVIANDLSHAPDVGGVVLTIRDVSERKLLEEELRHQAFHDGLTDLANRVLFNDRVEQALSRALRQGTMVAALLLDLDDFKLVNDTLGHSAGDDLLVQIGRRLRGCIRKGDTAARLGGDEFAICAEFVPTDKDDPSGLASRILEAFTFPFMVEGTELEARMSIGVAIAGDHTRSVDMLRDADLALYAAKNAGKATFRLFEPKLHQAVVARLEWRAALEKAIKGGELRLYYQPIVRLADETIVGLEGLVRWQHPVKGLVAPMEFIPLAEQTGLIIPLGAWVLGQACTDLARWQETWRVAYGTSPNVSVNVSPRQIHSGQFLKLVDQVLAEHSVDPTSLTLEITESCLAEDSDEVASCLRGLRDRGIALALDDFGTGYSSLSYLRRFPIQTLKIDRSFITAMDTPDGLTLVETIVSMARNLGLSVVAEGIEDAAQAAKLNMLGCDTGQGFLFWRPMPADGIDQLLEGKTEKVGEAAARQARALLATSH
jgi:diguanylate cyclase (GGDEF)-like protein/PAS domain S-box-containing protein